MTAFYHPEQTNADSVFLLNSFALISWSYNLFSFFFFLAEGRRGGGWFMLLVEPDFRYF